MFGSILGIFTDSSKQVSCNIVTLTLPWLLVLPIFQFHVIGSPTSPSEFVEAVTSFFLKINYV